MPKKKPEPMTTRLRALMAEPGLIRSINIYDPITARQDPDFVLVGRTDAMRTDGVAEGIRRGNLYAEAGCDMIEVFPNSYEEAALVPKEVAAPCLYVNSSGNRMGRPVIPWDELEDMGYKWAIDSTTTLIAAVQGVRAAMEAYMKKGAPPDDIAAAVETREWIETIIGLPEYYAIEARTVERDNEETPV